MFLGMNSARIRKNVSYCHVKYRFTAYPLNNFLIKNKIVSHCLARYFGNRYKSEK
jgi:hypothetical protein